MATDLPKSGESVEQTGRNLELFEKNMKKIEELSKRLVAVMGKRRKVPAALQGPSQELYLKAAQAWMDSEKGFKAAIQSTLARTRQLVAEGRI